MDQAGDASSTPGHTAASAAEQAALTVAKGLAEKLQLTPNRTLQRQSGGLGSIRVRKPTKEEKSTLCMGHLLYLQKNGTNGATVLQHPGLHACTGMCVCKSVP